MPMFIQSIPILIENIPMLIGKKFEDTKWVTTAVNGKKDLQHNDQKKKVQKTIYKTYT